MRDNAAMTSVTSCTKWRVPVGTVAASLSALAVALALATGPAHANAPAKKRATQSAGVQPNETLKSCSWDRPGKNPYMGELSAAVDRYTDIPAAVRSKLKERIARQQYDDVVVIKRDTITSEGKFIYAAAIRDMHFGDKGRMCNTVTRTRWKPTMTERGLVYCEGEQCVMVPTVCRNVSRVSRRPDAVAAEKTAAPSQPPIESAAAPVAPIAAKPDGESAVVPAPIVAGGAAGPAFSDVTQGPIFAFPTGPSGTSSVAIVAPPPSTGGGGGGGGGGGTPDTGGPAVVPPPGGGGGVAPPAGGGGSVVGGDTVVPAIPEPSTWLLMLGGLALLGFFARRRR